MSISTLSFRDRKGIQKFLSLCWRDRHLLLLMFLPFMYFVVFRYLPMYGAILAFKDFSIGKGILGSPWVGFKWFEQFFTSAYCFRIIRNTFLLSSFSLIFSFPVPIIFAIMLNEVYHKRYRSFVQTVCNLPYFISLVVAVGIVVNFLNPDEGIVNIILKHLGIQSINFMNDSAWFRPVYIISGIWQNFGIGSVVYVAAISSIDPQLFEAGTIDGATRLQKIRYITIPSISTTIVILLILNLGGLLSIGFEKIILLYNPGTYSTADVISTYVYRRGLQQNEIGFGSAVGLFNSVVNFVLLIIFNRISRKVSDISLW